MSEASQDQTGIDIPKDRFFLSHRQVEAAEQEIRSLEGTLSDPRARLEDRGAVIRQLNKVKGDVSRQAPPETTGAQRDALAKELAILLEDIKVGMPSYEEMRKCPPGAIGKHQRHEKAKKYKMIRAKNIMRVLGRGNEDPDVSNLELIRPKTSSLNMDNALIPGTDYFPSPNTPQYKEGWERTFGGGEASPSEVQALLKKIEDLEARIDSKQTAPAAKPQRKREMVPAACGQKFAGNAGVAAHERHHKCNITKEAPQVE